MNITEDQVTAMLGGESASEGTFWNFSNKEADNFMPSIKGDVVKISCGQEKNWDPVSRKFSGYKFWKDGNPRITHLLHIKDSSGRVWIHEIKPKSGTMMEDWLPVCPKHNLMGLLGMNIEVEAAQPPINPQTGQEIPFSSAMRRTFKVVVIGPGSSEVDGVDIKSYQDVMSRKDPSTSQQQNPVQQAYQQQQAQQYPQQYQQQPQYQQQQQMPQSLQNAMGAAQQASVLQQTFPGARIQQPPQPTMQQPQPAPQVPAQQMPPVDVYDSDIPF